MVNAFQYVHLFGTWSNYLHFSVGAAHRCLSYSSADGVIHPVEYSSVSEGKRPEVLLCRPCYETSLPVKASHNRFNFWELHFQLCFPSGVILDGIKKKVQVHLIPIIKVLMTGMFLSPPEHIVPITVGAYIHLERRHATWENTAVRQPNKQTESRFVLTKVISKDMRTLTSSSTHGDTLRLCLLLSLYCVARQAAMKLLICHFFPFYLPGFSRHTMKRMRKVNVDRHCRRAVVKAAPGFISET